MDCRPLGLGLATALLINCANTGCASHSNQRPSDEEVRRRLAEYNNSTAIKTYEYKPVHYEEPHLSTTEICNVTSIFEQKTLNFDDALKKRPRYESSYLPNDVYDPITGELTPYIQTPSLERAAYEITDIMVTGLADDSYVRQGWEFGKRAVKWLEDRLKLEWGGWEFGAETMGGGIGAGIHRDW